MAEKNTTAVEERQLVVFDLANEAYGVDINAVDGIIRMQVITKVPMTLDFVEGVINLRGEVIPVVDMRKRFGLQVTEETKDSRIVVVDISGHKVGMVVDAVTEVLRITADSIEPPSSVITTADSSCLMGIAKVEDRLIILLDLDQVFTETEKYKMHKVSKKTESAKAQTETVATSVSADEIDSIDNQSSTKKAVAAGSKKG